MELREAISEDVPAMVRTLVLVAPEGSLGTEPPVDESARAEALTALILGAGPAASWVLHADGEMVGHLTLVARPGGTLGVGMVLRREGRGQGGGRMLLEPAIAHARGRGVHKLELEVWPDNVRAIALYVGTGFVVEGFKRDHYRRRDGSLRSALIMGLALTGE